MNAKRGPGGAAHRLTPDQLARRLAEAAAHRVAGRLAEATQAYAAIEAAHGEVPDAPYFLALIDLAQRRPAPAADRLARLARRWAGFADVWEALAFARRELGQWREAAEASRRALALKPELAGERFALAQALRVLGRQDEAFGELRALADDSAHRITALVRLASAGALSDEEAQAVIAAARDEALPILTRVSAGFAAGSLLERAGRIDEAFAAFAAANRLKRDELTGEAPAPPRPVIGPATRTLHPDEFHRQGDALLGLIRAVFTPEFLSAHAGRGHPVAAPIFIIGMPRSGSTLIEQILSSHPKVQGLGEANALPVLLADRFPYAVLAPEQPHHFRRLAQDYLAAMHAQGWTSSARFVDKMLRNYMYVGAIHLMFPSAVILHARRDAVDTCLANFRQNFATGNETSYDLADIGREYVRYRQVMAHWDAVLPGRVVDVDHEALVADPERMIRWLVTETCGLAWNDACLSFHETRRAVRTASVDQVRQPIFTTSLRRWRRYEKHLGPLLEALGPYAREATG